MTDESDVDEEAVAQHKLTWRSESKILFFNIQKFYKEFNIMASLRSVNIIIHNLDGNLLYIDRHNLEHETGFV